MKKIPFDIAYRPQIESGEYKVVTRDGSPARIICWDRKVTEPYDRCTLVALVTWISNNESSHFYYPDGHIWDKSKDGGDSHFDLFIITPEPELTEFEQKFAEIINDWQKTAPNTMSDITNRIKDDATKLLELAKKELCKDDTEKKERPFYYDAEE